MFGKNSDHFSHQIAVKKTKKKNKSILTNTGGNPVHSTFLFYFSRYRKKNVHRLHRQYLLR